jgi:hypothetical protein
VPATTFAARALTWLALAAGAYLAVLLQRYHFTPALPRFRVETIWMWFLALGVLAVMLRRSSEQLQTPDQSPPERPKRPELTSVDVSPVFERWHYIALGASFAVIALALYGSAVRVGLLSDDFVLADWSERREWVHAAETGFVRPLVPMFWSLLSLVPLRFEVSLHTANILLHAANAVLVVIVGVRTGLRRGEAIAAGVLFLTASALTEAIVWVSGMQDVLMSTLALASLVALLEIDCEANVWRARQPNTFWLVVAAVLPSAMALGVKETAVIIPVLGWLLAWASPQGIGRGTRRSTLAAMTAVAAAYVIIRVIIGVPAEYGERVSRYFAKQLLVEPFATLGAPWSTAWLRSHPVWAFARSVVIVGLIAAGVSIWGRGDAAFRRALVFATWVLLAVLPVFSLFYVSPTLEGSRYVYLSSAGFSLLLAVLIGTVSRRTSVRSGTEWGRTGVRVGSDRGQTGVGPGSEWGRTSVRPGSDRGQSGVRPGSESPKTWQFLPGPSLFVVGALVGALAVPSVQALGPELRRWTDAADLRDRIVASYIGIMSSVRCRSVVTEGLADNIDGAYVLRNGFAQAVARRALMASGTEEFQCRVSWTDHIIVRQE